MGNFNAKYDPSEIYSNSEYEDSDDNASKHHLTTDTPLADIFSSLETPNANNIKSAQANEDFDSLCSPCIASKQSRAIVHKTMTEMKEKLEEVYVNLWGPHYPASLSGKKYAAILLDAKTGKTWIHYLRSKDEFVDVFQIWLPKVENECAKSMRVLHADGGGEFVSTKLKNIYEQKRIAIKYAVLYMHEKNGMAKRGWKIVMTMKDFLLVDSGLSLEFWAEAMDIANYIQNRLPTKSQIGELVLEEAWTRKKQDISHMKVFSSIVSVLIPKEKRQKSDIHQNWKGIFVGYSQDIIKHVRA